MDQKQDVSGFKTWVEISRSALEQNYQAFRKKIGDAKLMAVVKSNAYGHGLIEVAKIGESQADWFGVDSVDEALQLRKAGIRLPILILGFIPLVRLTEAIAADVSFMLYNQEMVDWLKQNPQAKKAKVHLELETGLTRQGIDLGQLQYFTTQVVALPGVEIEGVATHFADVEDKVGQEYAELQLKRFEEGIKMVLSCGPNLSFIHAACSAATVMRTDANFNLVRLGIGQYGLWSSEDMRKKGQDDMPLAPVMTWKTRIAQVKQVKAGTPVSYGMTESVQKDSLVVVLPIGYWDGFDRVANSSNGTVLISGKRCKVLGRVCMNMCMADATDVADVHVGDEVVLLGEQGNQRVPAEYLAQTAETINYEIVTRINPLIPRVIVE